MALPQLVSILNFTAPLPCIAKIVRRKGFGVDGEAWCGLHYNAAEGSAQVPASIMCCPACVKKLEEHDALARVANEPAKASEPPSA